MTSRKGFTILEIMVVVGIIAMLMAIVIVGINPARQIATTRNAQRTAHVGNILGGINHYALDGFGGYPTELDGTLRMLGTSPSGCAVTCGPDSIPSVLSSFIDNASSIFNLGTFNNTQWNSGTGAVDLTSAGLSAKTGTYTSSIKDAGATQTWSTFAWTPSGPYTKELPNNGASETAYPTGNASMANNVLLMHMNQTSGTITDSSGNNNNGVNSNASYAVAGKFNTAMNFNGSNSYVQVNSAASLNLPQAGGSVMLWMRPNVTLPQDTGMGIIRKPDYNGNLYSPGGYGLEIYRNTPAGPQNIKAHLGWNNGLSNAQQTLIGATNIMPSTWYHVALTWNATNAWIYVNGVQDATATRTAPLNWTNGLEKLYIGHNADSVSNGRQYFNGPIDEVALFGRTLSAAEVLAAYKRGAIQLRHQVRTCEDATCSGESFIGPAGTTSDYYTEANNTGTGLPSFTMAGPTVVQTQPQALSFDGVNDWVNIPTQLSTNAYTKTAWIKLGSGASATNGNIISGGDADGKHAFWAPSAYSLKLSAGHNGSWSQVQDPLALQIGQWYFAAVTYDSTVSSGTMKLYKDGQLVSSATNVSTFTMGAATHIGQYAGANFFNGAIDEARIYNRALTQNEITTLYQFGSVTSGLIGYWSFDTADMSGTTAYDRSGSGNNGTLVNGPILVNGANATGGGSASSPATGRYMQYKSFFDTDTSSYGPELRSITGNNDATSGSGTATTEQTADACIDLTGKLTPTYITSIPFDPVVGSAAKTYYAVKKINMDGITVRACSPQLGKSIEVVQ